MSQIMEISELNTGNHTVDFQHQQILRILDSIDMALQEKHALNDLVFKLETLYQHSVKHFKDEDHLMNSQGYKRYPRHKSRHEYLLMLLRQTLDAYRNQQGDLRADTQSLLDRYIRHHTTEDDLEFRQWLKAN